MKAEKHARPKKITIKIPLTPAYENDLIKICAAQAELTLTYKKSEVILVQTAVTEPVKVGFFKAQPEHALLASVIYPYEFSDNYDEKYCVTLQNNDVTREKTIELNIQDSDGATFCSLHIYSDYAALAAQNEYWKKDETLKNGLKDVLQQSMRAANNTVIQYIFEREEDFTLGMGIGYIEARIGELELKVPVCEEYENEQIAIKKTQAKLKVNFVVPRGLYTAATRPVKIGTLKGGDGLALFAKLSFPYEYAGGLPNIFITQGAGLACERSISLTIATKDKRELCTVTPYTARYAAHCKLDEAGKNGLTASLQEALKKANALILNDAYEHRLKTCVRTPPPVLSKEQNKRLSFVYQNEPERLFSYFHGLYDPAKKYWEYDEVYDLKTVWGGTFRVKKGQQFYRYPGQDELPREIQSAWNDFLREQLGGLERCSSHGYHGFACGGQVIAAPVFLENYPAWPYCQNGDDFYDPDTLEDFDKEQRYGPPTPGVSDYRGSALGCGIFYLLPLCTAHYNERGRAYCLMEDTEGIWFKDIEILVREGAKKWK